MDVPLTVLCQMYLNRTNRTMCTCPLWARASARQRVVCPVVGSHARIAHPRHHRACTGRGARLHVRVHQRCVRHAARHGHVVPLWHIYLRFGSTLVALSLKEHTRRIALVAASCRPLTALCLAAYASASLPGKIPMSAGNPSLLLIANENALPCTANIPADGMAHSNAVEPGSRSASMRSIYFWLELFLACLTRVHNSAA